MKCPTPLNKFKPNCSTPQPKAFTIQSQSLSKNAKVSPSKIHNRTATSAYFSQSQQETCSMEATCPNLVMIQLLKSHIAEITKENRNLKLINGYFLKQFEKNSMMKSEEIALPRLAEQGASQRPKMNFLEVVQSAIAKQEIKESNKTATPFQKNNKTISETVKANSLSDRHLIQNKKEQHLIEQPKQTGLVPLVNKDSKPDLPKKKFDYFKFLTKSKQKSANEHYDYLNNLVKQKNVKKNQIDSRVSFLSCEIPYLCNLITCDTFKQMKKISHSKSVFASSICSLSPAKLESVCDYITSIISDFDQSMNLVIRLKELLAILFSRHNPQSLSSSISYLLASGRSLLECQKVFIYLYDPSIDSLVIHHEEHEKVLKKNFEKNRDIVGYTFIKVQLQKIDDLAYDERFNKQLDKDLGFYSKSMLCSPLLDEEGKCIGVLQAINKQRSAHNNDIIFSADDEELMVLYTRYCEDIIFNAIQNERKVAYTNQMKQLIQYSIDIKHCDSILKLLSMSEKVLGELWSIKIAQVVLVNSNRTMSKGQGRKGEKEKGLESFVYYNESDEKCEKAFTGLLRKCYELKNNVICASSFEDRAYNHSVDIECCFSIITFPIYELKLGEIVAIGQVGTTLKFSKFMSNYLHQNEVTILATFSKILSTALQDKEYELVR